MMIACLIIAGSLTENPGLPFCSARQSGRHWSEDLVLPTKTVPNTISMLVGALPVFSGGEDVKLLGEARPLAVVAGREPKDMVFERDIERRVGQLGKKVLHHNF